MSGDTSRKPSGSSTHSRVHSPVNSPSNLQTPRKLHPGAYGVGIGQATQAHSLKGLNTGWQVWNGATASRNASTSSAPGSNEISPNTDLNFRSSIPDTWTNAPRSASDTWIEDGGENIQKTEFATLDQSSLTVQPPRHRQGQVTQAGYNSYRDDLPSGTKPSQLSTGRYDRGRVTDANGPRFTSVSPSRPFGNAGYPGQQSVVQRSASAGSYDTIQASPSVNDDLLMAMRGMVVEDDRNSHSQRPAQQNMFNAPPPSQQLPFNTYIQDFNGYYPPPPREHYVEFPFPYSGPPDPSLYSSPALNHATPINVFAPIPPQTVPTLPHQGMSLPPQTLHPNAAMDMRPQPGFIFDPRSGGSQFFYHSPQPIIFPAPTHSPIITTSVGPGIPVGMLDKPDGQFNMQSGLLSHANMYGNMRSSSRPSQPYMGSVEYNGSVSPLILPDGSVYQPGNSSHMYHHGIRSARRDPRPIGAATRSAILEEFRSNKARKWELEDIIGHVVEFSRDQHGSRFIQQRIESASDDEKEAIFDEIVPSHTLPLMQDVFGNYVVQKLFEFGSQQQKTILVDAMDGQVLALTLQMYGCRVVQKAIENVLPEQQSLLVRQIEPHVLRCVKDSNGNHVIQKLVERVPAERLGFIYAFRGHVYELATHPYGCRVLQRCLEHLPEEQTRSLMEEVLANAHKLMTDQFGNYVMQFILEHGRAKDKALVISKLRGQLLYMARHKFASNVCEKALLFSDSESRRVLIDEIILIRPDGFMPYVAMMKDQYANYVLQRALVVSEGDQREALYSRIKPQLGQMRKFATPYSKHLVSIERLLEKHYNETQLQSQPETASKTESD